jgi:two-component system response regulator AdeR
MHTQDINEPTIARHVNEAPSPTQPTLLIATVNEARRQFLAFQLDADGYTVHEADHLATVVRRTLEDASARHLHVGEIHVDLSARTVTVAGTVAHVSPREFALLVKFAGDPVRVFSKHELARCIWRQQRICERTVDSHIARLRGRLTQAGAQDVLVNKWGQGWSLTTPQ